MTREPSPSLASAVDRMLTLHHLGVVRHDERWSVAWGDLRAARSAPAPQDSPVEKLRELLSDFRNSEMTSGQLCTKWGMQTQPHILEREVLRKAGAILAGTEAPEAGGWCDAKVEHEAGAPELCGLESPCPVHDKPAEAAAGDGAKLAYIAGYEAGQELIFDELRELRTWLKECPDASTDWVGRQIEDILTARGTSKPAEPKAGKDRKANIFDTPMQSAEPKATSATVKALERVKESGHCPAGEDCGPPWIYMHQQADKELKRARAEAKEAPEPERRDSLLILQREFAKRAQATRDHLAWEIAETMVDAELSKQPAKEAPSGEDATVNYFRVPRDSNVTQDQDDFWIVPRCHAELTRAGIPDGALDERVRKLAEHSKHFQIAMDRYHKERDAARQEAADAKRVCDKPGCLSAVVRKDDGSRFCAAGHASRFVERSDMDAARQEAANAAEQAVAEMKAKATAQRELAAACAAGTALQAEVERLRKKCDEIEPAARHFCDEAVKARDAAIARAEAAEHLLGLTRALLKT